MSSYIKSDNKLFKINRLLANGWKRVSMKVWHKDDKIFKTAEEAFEQDIVDTENKKTIQERGLSRD